MGEETPPPGKPRLNGPDRARRARGEAEGTARPTATTISKLAGVAPSTVSRALKNHPSISPATRARVAALAESLGYRPNAIARSLITRRSNLVAFIMGELANPFYSEQLDLLLRLLGERDIQLMLFHVPNGHDVAEVVPMLLQYQLDACLIASVSLSSRASEILEQHRLPTVMINRVPEHRHGCAALCDNEGAGAEVARFLAARGMRRPAFVAGHADASTSRDRERGFLTGLADCGLSLALRLEGNYSIEGGFRAGQILAEAKPRPDAVFCANDIMAFGVLDALRLAGVKVPGQIQVVGFDDIRAAAWRPYCLTTVAQPMDVLLERAVDLIMARIEKPGLLPEAVYVAGAIRERGTTRRVP